MAAAVVKRDSWTFLREAEEHGASVGVDEAGRLVLIVGGERLGPPAPGSALSKLEAEVVAHLRRREALWQAFIAPEVQAAGGAQEASPALGPQEAA